jgi:hypothetical protein
MSYTNTDRDGTKYGATFLASHSPTTARAIVVDLVQKNPHASKEELFTKFAELVEGNKEYRRAIDWYFFINMHTYAHNQRRDAPVSESSQYYWPQTTSMARKIERQEYVAESVKQKVAQIALLFLTMPNGKAMRYCTGREMATFGAGYAKIAKSVGAKTVGEVLNEEEVRRLMATK